MEIRLAFDPRLQVDPATFAALWREQPEHLALGTLALDQGAPRRTFQEPSTFLIFLGGVASGVLTNALWDAIKWTYARYCTAENVPAAELEIQHLKQADGAEITLIRLKQ